MWLHYGVSQETEAIDYDALEKLALEVKPQMITAGASAYSRTIDFERMGQIARACGAYLFVDMAHIAGLVAGGQHPNPVPYADFVSSTTHKSLRGPRRRLRHLQGGIRQKTGCRRLPRNAGRSPHAHHCR